MSQAAKRLAASRCSCRMHYAFLSRCKRHRGSALIEFVILVPLLILLLLVIADFGRITPWAQQVAYSADAGAQYAYQIYSTDDVMANAANIIAATRNAAPALELQDDEVAVSGDWRCRSRDYDSDAQQITVRYSSSSVSQGHDCTGDSCGGEACEPGDPVLFIVVTVTDSFEPFSQFIADILPSNLTNFSTTSRRQIFGPP